jgi:hypothetical protein
MILCYVEPRSLCQVFEARLMELDGTEIGSFGASERVTEYLTEHPDSELFLAPFGLVRELQDADRKSYHMEEGHIYCGMVRFDANAGCVICE